MALRPMLRSTKRREKLRAGVSHVPSGSPDTVPPSVQPHTSLCWPCASPASGNPGPQPLNMLRPGVTMDDDVFQIGVSIQSVRLQYSVHEALQSAYFFLDSADKTICQ